MIKKIIFSLAFIGTIHFAFAQTNQQKADSLAAVAQQVKIDSLAAVAQIQSETNTAVNQYAVLGVQDSTKKDSITKPEIYKATYRSIFMGYGFVAGKSDSVGDAINYGKSTDFIIGYRFKKDLCSFDAIGYDVDYHVTYNNLKQDSAKLLPNNIQHTTEKMNFNNFELALYNRFQIGNSAHSLGRYLDIGAYGDWTFSVVHKTTDKHSVANAAGASVTYTQDEGLVFVNPFNYGVLARIGFNNWLIYGNYRLSKEFKTGYIFPELPRITVGIQREIFGIRKQKK
ncbi:MAG: hypothetical protein ABI199_03525 [Bacteroidia bacterium]